MVIWLSSCLAEEAGLKPTSPEFDLSARQYSYTSQLLFFCLDIADGYTCPHILSGKSNFFLRLLFWSNRDVLWLWCKSCSLNLTPISFLNSHSWLCLDIWFENLYSLTCCIPLKIYIYFFSHLQHFKENMFSSHFPKYLPAYDEFIKQTFNVAILIFMQDCWQH